MKTSDITPATAQKTFRGAVAAACFLLLPAAIAAGSDPSNDLEEQEQDRQEQVENDRADVERDGDFDSDQDTDRDNDQDHRDRARGIDLSKGESEPEIEPDEVVAIDLSAEGRAQATSLGFRVKEEDTLTGLGFRLARLAVPGGIPPRSAVQRLREADRNGTYDVNPRYTAAALSACEGIRCDGQKLLTWPIGGCQEEVAVGLVDTAVAESSPALAGSRISQRHFGSATVAAQDADHGTEVATILSGNIGAGYAGLIPRARLFAADVFHYGAQSGESTNAVLMAQGFDWLSAQPVGVINVSIAGPDNVVLHETIRRVTARGIPVVAAAGNLGPEGPPRYPAAYPEAIAVTAVDHAGQLYVRASRGGYVDVAAPGVNVWSAGADGRGRFVDGTSFAAPFVAAEVALVHLATPRRTPGEIKAQLRLGASTPASGHPHDSVGLLKSPNCTAAPVLAAK